MRKRFERILIDRFSYLSRIRHALLNAEADTICQASRYQPTQDRQDTRAGSYKRKLLTKADEVELRLIPKTGQLDLVLKINLEKEGDRSCIYDPTPGTALPDDD